MDVAEVWNLLGVRSVVVGLLICVLVYLCTRAIRSRHRKLPPGPWGWPVIGCLPQIVLSRELPQVYLSKLAERYGDVFSLKIAGQLVVVINKYSVVKEAFAQPRLCDRLEFQVSNRVAPGFGVATSSGEMWAVLRKFHATVFRELGLGKLSFEHNISTEVSFLVAEMKKRDGAAFDLKYLMDCTSSNVLCSVVFGKRFEYSNHVLKQLLRSATIFTSESGPGFVVEAIPMIANIFPFARRYVEGARGVYSLLAHLVKEHQQTGVYNRENPGNFIDQYLARCTEGEGRDTPDAKAIKPEYLKRAIGEIFLAGTETTSTTLRWGLLYMMAHPQVQTRVQEELDGVTGRDRCPGLADRSSLPYTEAVICEIQRITSIVPVAVPHYCTKEALLRGFTIPKGAVVLSNLWHIHNDPSIWAEPKEFRPERFLDDEGRLRLRKEFLPFGLGRRVCIGENLARMEVFIIFTHLLHQFTFEKPDSSRPVSLDGNLGITWAPLEYRVRAIVRD